jgi:hypothetical protein
MNSLSCPFGAPDSHVKRRVSLTVFAQAVDCKAVATNSTRERRLIVNDSIFGNNVSIKGAENHLLETDDCRDTYWNTSSYIANRAIVARDKQHAKFGNRIVPKGAEIVPKRQKRIGS